MMYILEDYVGRYHVLKSDDDSETVARIFVERCAEGRYIGMDRLEVQDYVDQIRDPERVVSVSLTV